MGRKLLDIGKNILIAAMAAVIVLLALMALPQKTLTSVPWLTAVLRPVAPLLGMDRSEFVSMSGESEENVHAAALPVAVSLNSSVGRCSIQYRTDELDEIYEQAGGLLAQALDSAESVKTVTQAEFRHALMGESAAFRYPAKLQPVLLGAWLRVQAPEADAADWFVLCAEQDGVNLYLGGDTFSVCETSVPAEDLRAFLEGYTPDGSFFALEDETGRYAGVDAVSLIGQTQPHIFCAQGTNPCDARTVESIAGVLGFNPYGESRFTDDSGTTFFTDTGATMTVSPQGRISLRMPEESRFISSDSGQDDLIETARQLISAVTSGLPGSARLYLSGIAQNGDTAVVTFDYYLNGVRIVQASGSAAEIRFTGRKITEASVLVRSYSRTDREASLLPAAQAASVVQKNVLLEVLYADSGLGELGVSWRS